MNDDGLGPSQVRALLQLARTPTDMRLTEGTHLGPYEILAPLGRGGMGEVYHAYDGRLNRSVAIKIVTGAIDDDLRARFMREARAVAHVEHPHVCRVYDVGRDQDVDYLVMEYLEGETLASRLTNSSLPAADAIAIARQIAEALASTHDRGLVHRDLKPGNIILTGTGAKVLDFGLSGPASTETATIAGTLQYMAPEQIDGLPATPQSDIFALGSMLYEMLAGRRAFAGENASATIAAILHQDPPPLPDAGAGSPAVASTVSRCLAKNAADRWPSAQALAEALRDVPQNSDPQRTWMKAAVVMIGIALLIGMGLALTADRRAAGAPPVAAAADNSAHRSIAVLGFKNLSGRADADWLSTALAEMLTTELIAGDGLRAIAGENVARMKAELKLIDTDAYASDTLARIKTNLGADLIMLGSYVVHDDTGHRSLRLDLRVQDTHAGGRVASVGDSGREENLPDLVSRIGSRLRTDLGIDTLSTEQSASVRATLPSSTEAIRLYAEGLSQYRLSNTVASRDLLMRAVAADPSNAIARSALAAAWSALGYDTRARNEAQRAVALAGALPREQRLPIEAHARALAGDSQTAIAAYRELSRLHPDDLDCGLALVDAQVAGGAPKEALATIASLRKRPAPWGTHPRLDVAEATTNSSLGNFAAAHALAMTAAQKAAERGAALLVAEARRVDGVALSRLARYPEALASSAEAQRLAREAGDRNLEALATATIGNIYFASFDFTRAKPAYEQAQAIFRAIGRPAGVASTLYWIANIEVRRGHIDAALRAFDEALAIARELGRKKDVTMTLNSLGSLMYVNGDLRGAIARLQKTLSVYREVGDKSAVVTASLNLASAIAEDGALAEAQRLLTQALHIGRETGEKALTVLVLSKLAELTAATGDLHGAATLCQDALALSREIQSTTRERRAARACALVAMEQGKIEEAERFARSTFVLSTETRLSAETATYQGMAFHTLAEVYLAGGRLPEARRAFDGARTGTGFSMTAGWEYDTTAARVRMADAPAEAATALRAVADAATKRGYLHIAYEARFHLAEAERRANRPQAARAGLERLQRDAAAKGYGLIARKAAAALAVKTAARK
jgi:eukaryotic-like serine/threonine-protein kinase